MKIIVPMAGMGKRMRPHTLTVPKPLIPVAGKPIVERLVTDIAAVCEEKIEEIAFIIGDFGSEVEARLMAIAESLGARGTIYYQEEALGTAHAILCAADSLDGKTVVAFADTLFHAEFKLEEEKDGIIWVQQVEDPSAFGVVTLNDDGVINEFVEKPETFVSDLAIIGIYYFRDGLNLKNELQYLIDNDIRDKGEYQLTNALENMKQKGLRFYSGEVDEWMDCGNKNATVATNSSVLQQIGNHVSEDLNQENSLIIEPCFIGKNVKLENSIIGPYVSIGDNTVVTDSVIRDTIIQQNANVQSALIENSMIGNDATYEGRFSDLSVGDFNQMK